MHIQLNSELLEVTVYRKKNKVIIKINYTDACLSDIFQNIVGSSQQWNFANNLELVCVSVCVFYKMWLLDL